MDDHSLRLSDRRRYVPQIMRTINLGSWTDVRTVLGTKRAGRELQEDALVASASLITFTVSTDDKDAFPKPGTAPSATAAF